MMLIILSFLSKKRNKTLNRLSFEVVENITLSRWRTQVARMNRTVFRIKIVLAFDCFI